MHSHPDFASTIRTAIATGVRPPGITAVDPAEADRRFAVYRNNVAVALSEALGRRFPVLRRLVGEPFFQGLALAFRTAHPPTSPVMQEWGSALPAFLEGFAPAGSVPYLPDVARLELARGHPYHAADVPPLAAPDLARLAADPAAVTVALHPSVTVLSSQWVIVSIWAANQPGATPGPLRADVPETAIVLRDRNFSVPVWTATAGDAAFLLAAQESHSLLDGAEAAQQAEPGHDTGTLLARLVQAGALIAFKPGDAG